MNCKIVQRGLLAAEQPKQVGADVKRHLTECAACRALHGRLVQLESEIPQIPVPVSTRRAGFVAQFVQQTPAEIPLAERPLLPLVKLHRRVTPPRERGRRKLAIVLAALAACLAFLVFSTLSALLNDPPDPGVKAVSNFEIIKGVRIASANTPEKKVEEVAGVAREVRDRVRTLAKDGDPKVLAALAQYYQQLLAVDLKTYVHDLPKDAKGRAALNALAVELQQTESEFTNLAATARTEAKQPLQQIAKAALDAQRRVNDLLNADA